MSTDEQKPNEELEKAKMNAVKVNLHNSLNKVYTQLTSFINTLPINPQLLSCAMMNLDQGYMWAREGINTLQFKVEEVPPTPTSPENQNATSEGKQQESNPEEHQDGNQSGSEAEPSCSDSLQCGKEGETDGA